MAHRVQDAARYKRGSGCSRTNTPARASSGALIPARARRRPPPWAVRMKRSSTSSPLPPPGRTGVDSDPEASTRPMTTSRQRVHLASATDPGFAERLAEVDRRRARYRDRLWRLGSRAILLRAVARQQIELARWQVRRAQQLLNRSQVAGLRNVAPRRGRRRRPQRAPSWVRRAGRRRARGASPRLERGGSGALSGAVGSRP
jgi:hypothetical protein